MNTSSGNAGHWCERLYEDQAANLILYGRALGLSHSEAEDVLQDTFQALLKCPHPPQNLVCYCLRSYRNRALNHWRGRWRRWRREIESRDWFEPAVGETEGERQALRCLERLPTDQREAIVLRIWHQYTLQEIADLLGLSANTVAGRYRYGMEKIRRALKGANHELDEPLGEPTAALDTPTSIAPA